MSASPVIFDRTPGLLSFQRAIAMSDARLYSDIGGALKPLPVIRHGIRGTQNINKPGANTEISNIQMTDSARLDADADAMVAKFSIKFLDLQGALVSIGLGAAEKKDGDKKAKSRKNKRADAGEPVEAAEASIAVPGKSKEELAAFIRQFRDSLTTFIEQEKDGSALIEVANRYARNLLNGRWLWRNRTMAQAIELSVRRDDEALACVEALSIPMQHFRDYVEAERAVGEVIASGLRGDARTTLHVSARVDFGFSGGVEVYPSQNYLQDKPTGFARSLYYLGDSACALEGFGGLRQLGQAALRDQKVCNALRTIDTWYAPNADIPVKPIPVEPQGANLEAQAFFRTHGDNTAFDYIKRLATLDENEKMFMLACLVRGGVYSGG